MRRDRVAGVVGFGVRASGLVLARGQVLGQLEEL